MGLIRAGVAVALFCAAGMCLYAQSAGVEAGIPLQMEIQSIGQTLSQTGISASERYEALIRLARIQQLSGDFEGAAKNWLEAASALADARESTGPEPGDAALIAGVYCLFAMGEWEQGEAVLRPLLYSGRQGQVMLYARYLEACARLWKSGETAVLIWLADHAEYTALRPVIYYTLWRAFDSEASAGTAGAEWKDRLINEFPGSPEGRIASAGGSDVISGVSSPMWLLLPEYGGYSAAPAPPVVTAVPVAPPAPEAGMRVLQTGLFNSEVNARVQTERLGKAGFSASLSRRNLNGAEGWAVIVPPGPDINRTIRELKSAGFDAFPVNAL